MTTPRAPGEDGGERGDWTADLPLDDLLAAYREVEGPVPEQRAALWSRVADADVGGLSVAAEDAVHADIGRGPTRWSKTLRFVAYAAAAAVAVVALGQATNAVRREDAPREHLAVDGVSAESEGGLARSRGSSHASARMPRGEAPTTPSPLDDSEDVQQEEAPRRPSVTVSRPRAAESDTAESRLGVEATALGRADRLLRAGDVGAARRVLADYGRRFPDGVLRELHDALAAVAGCQSDRNSGAVGARDFHRKYPGSPYRERVQRSCAQ